MKRILFLLLVAFAFSPAVEISRSQSSAPRQDTRINLSGIWEDAGNQVTITDTRGSVTARYSKQKQCRHEGSVTPYSGGFVVSGTGSTLRGTGTICYYGERDPDSPAPRGVKQDSQVTITVSADGKTLTGTQIGYHGPISFTLKRKCDHDPGVSSGNFTRDPFGPETPADIAPSCESCPGGTWKLKLAEVTYHSLVQGNVYADDKPMRGQCVYTYESIWFCPPTSDVAKRTKIKTVDEHCIVRG